MAASEELNALFIGGYSSSGELNGVAESGSETIVLRQDLLENRWIWRKSYKSDGENVSYIINVLSISIKESNQYKRNWMM